LYTTFRNLNHCCRWWFKTWIF